MKTALAVALGALLLGGCIPTPERRDPLAGLDVGEGAPFKRLSAAVVYSGNTKASIEYLHTTLRSYDPGPQLLNETDDFFRKLFKSSSKADTIDGAAGLGTDLVVVLDANVQTATFLTQKYTFFADIGLVLLSSDGKEIERLRARRETSMFAHATVNQPVIDVWQGAMGDLATALLASDKLKAFAQAQPSHPASTAGLNRDDILRLMKQAVQEAAPAKPTPGKLVSDVDKPAYSKPENPDDFAVVVGVENYPGLPHAQFADRDAEAVRAHLMAMGYPARNIAVLSDQDATRAGLAKTLNAWLPNRVNEKSTVFFYYSGHGAPDAKSNLAYLVPIDGDPEDLEDTAYPVKELYEKLGGLKAKQVIVALDSCFSGAGGRSVLAKDARPLVTKIDAGDLTGGKVVSLSASKSDQISGAVDDQGHGAFTYYLLKGLNGAAKDAGGRVTARSLYEYLKPKVEDAARLHNRDQTPQLMPSGGAAGAVLIR